MSSGKYAYNYKGEFLEVAYFIRPGKNKTLIYIHGGACSSEDFLGATKREELKSYTIVRFDFPGCGDSSYSKHIALDIDIDALVEITKGIIHGLKLYNITLIGHSTGGLVALKYIVKYGDVESFINVEGNLAPENCVFSRKVVAIKSFDEYKNTAWPELQKNLKNSKNRGFQKWANIQKKASAKAFYDYCSWVVKYCDDPNTLNEYLNLKIPHLYIYGSENRESLTFLKRFKEANSKMAEVSNSNHFPFYDNPKEFYYIASKFLTSI